MTVTLVSEGNISRWVSVSVREWVSQWASEGKLEWTKTEEHFFLDWSVFLPYLPVLNNLASMSFSPFLKINVFWETSSLRIINFKFNSSVQPTVSSLLMNLASWKKNRKKLHSQSEFHLHLTHWMKQHLLHCSELAQGGWQGFLRRTVRQMRASFMCCF